MSFLGSETDYKEDSTLYNFAFSSNYIMRDFCNNVCKTLLPEHVVYKDVVIIGNGPSGITLSCLLSGYIPFYNGKVHRDEMLTARLQCLNNDIPLIEQDLQFLSQGLEGRSVNPVSVLLDCLSHPNDDQDVKNSSETLLEWKYDLHNSIDHIVLGKGKPGGCWQVMMNDILTISASSWMNLPMFSYHTWISLRNNSKDVSNGICANNKNKTLQRSRAKDIAEYYNDYVDHMRMTKNFHNFTYVSSIRKIKDVDQYNNILKCVGNNMDDGSKFPVWEVECVDILNNFCYKYLCQSIVLANGSSDIHKTLAIPGELSNPVWVCHDLKHFSSAIENIVTEYTSGHGSLDGINPVLIVGSGLSAADSVLLAKYHKVPILHVFTTCALLSSNLFPKNMYPEYNKVHRLMKGEKRKCNYYKAFPQHMVSDISSSSGREICLMSPNGQSFICKVSLVAIMIGYQPDLNFLPIEFDGGRLLGVNINQPIDSRKNPIKINPWTHEVTNSYPGLYAMGPLVGDNFVRVILGGAVAITSHLYKGRKKNV